MQKTQTNSFFPIAQDRESFSQPRAELEQARRQFTLNFLEGIVAFFSPITGAVIFVFILIGTLALLR